MRNMPPRVEVIVLPRPPDRRELFDFSGGRELIDEAHRLASVELDRGPGTADGATDRAASGAPAPASPPSAEPPRTSSARTWEPPTGDHRPVRVTARHPDNPEPPDAHACGRRTAGLSGEQLGGVAGELEDDVGEDAEEQRRRPR